MSDKLKEKDLTSIHKVKTDIELNSFRFKKSLGQNFLIDKNILNNIIEISEVSSEDVVIEIGVGIGTLTVELLKKAKRVIAVEIDKNLIPIIEENTKSYNNFTLINEDFLKVDIEKYINKDDKVKIIANLPYYITTPIIFKCLNLNTIINKMVFLIQKEVAERLTAVPSTKSYGSLTVAIQLFGEVKYKTTVSKNSFFPKPNVESAIVQILPYKSVPWKVDNKNIFNLVIRGAFHNRRKTLTNSLNAHNPSLSKEKIYDILSNIGIDNKRRGETLTISEFVNLSNEINKNKNEGKL